jgi:DNA-binding GntR family transcriptional regulator
MSAKNASASEARALGETRGTALLTMERIAYDEGGRPVEFGQHLYRASRYALTLTMPRAAQSAPTAQPTRAGGRDGHA